VCECVCVGWPAVDGGGGKCKGATREPTETPLIRRIGALTTKQAEQGRRTRAALKPLAERIVEAAAAVAVVLVVVIVVAAAATATRPRLQR
jgi:hypothetical protein